MALGLVHRGVGAGEQAVHVGILDEGPIIEQNVVRVDHSRSPAELVAIGQDEESRTLTQAVKWFAEDRVLLDGARTIIFR